MVYFKAHLLLALGDCKGVREEEVKPGYPTLKKQQQVRRSKLFTESAKSKTKFQLSTKFLR